MVATRRFSWLASALLALTNQAAIAAPSFIAGTRVAGDAENATIEIRFNCQVTYLQHQPSTRGDSIRIQVDPTTICNGVSPTSAQSRGRYRPTNADLAALIDIEYEGGGAGGPELTLQFSEPVSFVIASQGLTFILQLDVQRDSITAVESDDDALAIQHRQVPQPESNRPLFVINLASYRRIPTAADLKGLTLAPQQRVFYSELNVEDATWYRLRLGDFNSADDARSALHSVADIFDEAWIDQLEDTESSVDLTIAAKSAADIATVRPTTDAATTALSKIDRLMDEARATMVSGDRARAIQIYTKVLQFPEQPRQMEAQEFLALAREKNGQIAHAKAEYRRYLSLYPESAGAGRVSQRLAALLAGNQLVDNATQTAVTRRQPRQDGDWRVQTFFSQYYRRDVNQQNDDDEIVSQSALYSDVNFDARRRGERFDFSSRLTAGYRSDFLSEESASGNDTRVSYAYADLSHAASGLRGRIGRQSRNSGGILGRFDGLNLGYQWNERTLLSAVVGKPAYTSSDGIDSERTFYGISMDYGPLWDELELGVFFVQQDIDGLTDRQAIGGEFRYFSADRSFWGLIDYDTLYSELSSAFLQASWRISSRLNINGSFDKRRSPFLTAGNAIIGQPVFDFAELSQIFSMDEIRQLGLDRSPLSTSYTLGISYTLSPRIQISADANQTSIDATPASGGVLATLGSRIRYIAANIVASSLLREGDVSIIGFRQSATETSTVSSVTLDSRYPFNRTWRLNPRLRIDRRERIGDTDYEWIYTPGIRLQYRRSQRFRVELEAGKQFVQRETEVVNLDRESYFVNLGYQVFF